MAKPNQAAEENCRPDPQTTIEANKFYPRHAHEMHHQGKVALGFTVRRERHISDVRVAQGSGINQRERATKQAIQKAGHFQPFPANIHQQAWPLGSPSPKHCKEKN